MNKKTQIIYSTNPDYIGEEQIPETTITKEKQQLRVWKQRIAGDRILTIVKGFVGNENELQKLAKYLRTFCSSGGSVKDGNILIQGDHREKIVNFLKNQGYNAKPSGG